MMDIKKVKGLDKLSNVGKIVAVALPLMEPVVKTAHKKVEEKIEERRSMVEVPNLSLKEYPIELERAKVRLEELDLKAEPVAVRNADVQYKDCFDLQVVETKPPHREKVKSGTFIYLKYVTAEIIKESQKLYEDFEREKAIVQQKKNEKKQKRAEALAKGKEKLVDVVVHANSSIKKTATRVKRKKKDG